MFLLLLLASLPFGVLAAPTVVIVHPIRSQLPLIARVGSSYTWSISSSTFVVHNDDGHPISGAITYNVTGIPPWLSFSPTSLSFTGTVPSSASPGSLPITVTGSTGSSTTSISDTFDLLVSASKPPHVAIPLDQQLTDQNPALSGAFAVNPSSALPPFHSSSTPREGTSKAGIRLLPSSDFSIGLQGGTFAPWPLSYTASLMDGSPLPSWITYDPVTFTLDGTAPDSDNVPVSFEVAIAASDVNGYSAGPTARDSFWISVASHELKIKNGNAGISRNVSVGTGFVLDLMDGPNNDPWMGEVFWDSGFLSIDGVKDVSMNVSEGTTFAFDSRSRTLSGNIQASKIGKELHGLPVAITDIQNLTLNTLLVLNPIPSFFVLPSTKDGASSTGVFISDEGDISIPQNFSSSLSFDLNPYLAPNGPSSIKNGAVYLRTLITPDIARHWLSFDPITMVLGGSIPTKDEVANGSIVNRPSVSTASSKVTHERRKQHPIRQSQVGPGQVHAALSTPERDHSYSATTLLSSTSMPRGPMASSAPLAHLSTSTGNLTAVNVTFIAHSPDSRTISTLHVSFLLGANMTCPTASCVIPTSGSGDDANTNSRAAKTGLILALVFSSLLLIAAVIACYCMRRRRIASPSPSASTKNQPDEIQPRETKVNDTGWGRNSAAFSNGDLERGSHDISDPSRRALIHSMAETRSLATSMPRSGSGSGSNGSRAGTPTAIGHVSEDNVVLGPETLGVNSETSGSRYEEGTSIGTSYGLRTHGKTGSGSGTEKEAVSSGESDVEGRRLAPPSNTYLHSTRPISPAPLAVTVASGATIPKQTFFAKLKNFGPRPREDLSSQSSSGEEEPPSKVAPNPSIRIDKVPTNTSVFTNTMTVIKESSLGSLFGLSNGDDNGSVGSKTSNHSRGKLEKMESEKKLDIGRPRPLMPSLGAYLAKDHADQVARAAASAGIVSRNPTDDGGSGFVTGNVVIYSMENRPLPSTRPSSPQEDMSTFPPFLWPSPMQPQPTSATQSTYPKNQTSQKSLATIVQGPAKAPSVPTLLRNRSNEAAIPDATSHEDVLSSSSGGSTLNGDEFGEEVVLANATLREVPRRRQDFGRPQPSATESDAQSNVIPSDSTTHHSRDESQDTVNSLAAIGTAALTIRSSQTGTQVSAPSLPLTVDSGSAIHHNSPKSTIRSPPKFIDHAPTIKARLVQFVHEKQYDGGSSSEGAASDDPVAGAYSAYQGKREMSHKAVIEGSEQVPMEKWGDLPPAPTTIVPTSSSRLAEKVKMLREQSRMYHERQLKGITNSPPMLSTRRTPSPTDDDLLNDPALALGLQYMQSFGSDGSLSSKKEKGTVPRKQTSSPEATMGVAVGGDGNASNGSVVGRARVLNPGAMTHRSRPCVSQLQPSFLAYENDPQSSDSDRRTPPRIPLPAPPAMETQYFDLSESSSGSTSTSNESDVVVHRAGQQRILVGVNEAFNFPSPLVLPGFSPGQSSRTRILRAVKEAHQQRQQLQSNSPKESDPDGIGNDCRLWAQLEDGEKLPEWFGFDPLEAEFWGVPVPSNRGTSLRVKVYFRDGQIVREVAGFIVEVVGR